MKSVLRGRSWLAALAGGVLVVGIAAFGSPAGATSAQPGTLLIKGPGSGYAGPGSTVSVFTTAGKAAKFSFQVRNTSTNTAQFNVRALLSTETCPPSGGCPAFPDAVVTTGSLIVTKLTSGPFGYWTAPIDPGKSITYTLSITLPKTLAPTDSITASVSLYDINSQFLASDFVQAGVTATKGSKYADDEFITGAGGKAAGFWDDFTPQTFPTFVTAGSVALTKAAKFTVKLVNDSPTAASINFRLTDHSSCAAYFPAKVLAGKTDVTAAVLGGFYQTASLLPGKSATLSVAVTYLSPPSGCTTVSDEWAAISSAPGAPAQTLFLVTNPIFG